MDIQLKGQIRGLQYFSILVTEQKFIKLDIQLKGQIRGLQYFSILVTDIIGQLYFIWYDFYSQLLIRLPVLLVFLHFHFLTGSTLNNLKLSGLKL